MIQAKEYTSSLHDRAASCKQHCGKEMIPVERFDRGRLEDAMQETHWTGECFICGKHAEITQCHHAYPLSSAKYLLLLLGSIKEPPFIWLCPNCHAYYHLYSVGKLAMGTAGGFLDKAAQIYEIGMNYAHSELKEGDKDE